MQPGCRGATTVSLRAPESMTVCLGGSGDRDDLKKVLQRCAGHRWPCARVDSGAWVVRALTTAIGELERVGSGTAREKAQQLGPRGPGG